MKDFNKKYNDYFSSIIVNEELKNKVLENMSRKKEKTNHLVRRLVIPITLVMIFSAIFIGFGYGRDIVNAIKKLYVINTIGEEDDEITSCIVPNPILNIKNDDAYSMLLLKDKFTKKEIENILGIHVLENELIEDESFYVREIKEVDNKLAYAVLEKHNISVNDGYRDQNSENISNINLNVSFLTNNSTKEMRENKSVFEANFDNEKNESFSSFEAFNCENKNFDVYQVKSLNTNLFFYDRYADLDLTKEEIYSTFDIMPVAFFEYDNVLYSIYGEMISRNDVIDFVESLK